MMNILLLSVFYIINGILGLLGIMIIPERHQGTEYEKEYKRTSGIGWLLVGIPWLLLAVLTRSMENEDSLQMMLLIATAVPSLGFSLRQDLHFRKKK